MDLAMLPRDELDKLIRQVEKEMKEAAKALEFERAALLRDQLMELRRVEVEKRVEAV
jgi:excinuclease ABC subunit B